MQNKNKSAETMKGVFLSYKEGYQSQIKDYILTILINDPFNAKISIEIDTDEWNQYVNYSFMDNWRGFLDDHPENCYRSNFYFNLQEREFYIATIDDKGDRIWQKSTINNIIYITYSAWIFNRHIHTDFNRYHAGQQCEFQAYAIDTNGNLYKPSSLKKDFHEYQWKFYPTTFKAHEISENTIKYLVERTPISKETRDIVVRSYQEQNKNRKKANRKEKWETFWSNWKTFWTDANAHIEKYEKVYKYIVRGGFLWALGTLIFGLIKLFIP